MNRTLIWQLGIRYLRGKRGGNAAPILSRISMIAVGVSSAAMIIVFSVFNGLESIAEGLYVAFYPDVKISAARGKFFSLQPAGLDAIKHIPGVRQTTPVIEDNALVNLHDQQKVITLKGIDNSYFEVNRIGQYIEAGDSTVSAEGLTAIAGLHILNVLGTDVNNVNYMMLYYPNAKMTHVAEDPLSAFQSLKLHPAGTFRIGEEYDDKYILAPLPLVQKLFNEEGRYSSIELSAAPDAVEGIKNKLQQMLGSKFKVETRFEQNRTIFMAMKGEKLAIYIILLMVLFIASFNMVGALSMLVLEKQKDIAILRAMGAQAGTIKRIFLLESVLWAAVGGLSGVTLGTLLCLAQQHFNLIKVAGSTFLIDAYPVEMKLTDFVAVVITILGVGLLTGWYPAMRATKAVDPLLKSA